ncbi:MAG: TIGR02677 family protein [Solirubrobacteraceae bacterium]
MDPPRFLPFAHLTAPNAELYRRVMLAFVAAKRRFVVHLRAEDVLEALVGAEAGERTSAENVGDALAQLVDWGNLKPDPDTGRVTSVEDFHRARFLYQLTREGEAAERALAVYDEQLGRRGALQAVALVDIASGLRALRELAADADPDPRRVGLLLRDLAARFAELADNAQAFMGSLQRTIDLYDIDVDAFRAYKDRLIDYLERFIKDLVTIGGEISGLLGEIDAGAVERLLALVARREAEDAAPGSEALDSGGEDPRGLAFEGGLAAWRERWRGLRQWFLSEPGHPSQAKLLRGRARQAIPDLLAVVKSLNERRAGRSDRSADFRELAVWFAEAPDDAALHRLWRSAFGVYGSRHMTLDHDTRELRDRDPVPPSTSWLAAPPLLISPRLRRTGSYERRGKPNRVISRDEGRRLLVARVAREAEQTAAARDRLATDRPVRLGHVGELDPDAFRLFLELLGNVLSARRPGQRESSATTADGSLAISLTTLPDARPVAIRTPGGVFSGPDHLIEIVDTAGRGHRHPAGEPDEPRRLVA